MQQEIIMHDICADVLPAQMIVRVFTCTECSRPFAVATISYTQGTDAALHCAQNVARSNAARLYLIFPTENEALFFEQNSETLEPIGEMHKMRAPQFATFIAELQLEHNRIAHKMPPG